MIVLTFNFEFKVLTERSSSLSVPEVKEFVPSGCYEVT